MYIFTLDQSEERWDSICSNSSMHQVNRIFKVKVKVCHVQLFMTARTAALQVPLSMGFSRQEYWSGLPFPSPWDLPDLGIEPGSPALHADSLPPEPPGGCIKRVCEASRIEKNLQIIVNISVYHFISSKGKKCDSIS